MIKRSAQNNGGSQVNVLLASASAVRRAGLEAMLKAAPTLKLIGDLQGTQTAAARAVQLGADVLLVDLEKTSSLPIQSVLEIPSVLLVDSPEPGWAAHALRSGVKSILRRDSGGEDIIPAVMAAYSGFVFLDPTCARDLAQQVRTPVSSPAGSEHLTPRELEVLGMLAEGLGNRGIASRLRVSDHTVKFHISSILDKLGAATRTEAVTLGLRLGLILL